MKNFTIFIAIFSTFNIYAKCMTDTIAIVHESGFGISIGGSGSKSNYNDSSMVNVPLSINNERACFKKKNSFSIKTEENSDTKLGKLIITPLEAEFENVPNPSVKQYIFADKNKDSFQTKFYTMSFVCSGEIPLSIDANSDSYFEIKAKSKDVSIKITSTIATGAAAANLSNKADNPKAREAFNFFAKKFQLNQESKADMNCCNLKVPSLITSNSIESMSGIERAITSSFTTMASYVPNGCSSDYSHKMENYLIENYEKNESLEPFKISKKWFNKGIVLEWTN